MPKMTGEYSRGFRDAVRLMQQAYSGDLGSPLEIERKGETMTRKPKRKLSAWQKYIKNKRNHIKYRDGKLNLKKMGVAFRRKKRR